MNTNRSFALGTRWTARIWSLVSLAFVGLFVIAHLLAGDSFQFTPSESVLFLFFPVGVVIGLLLAWWKELIGGATTIVSLIGFYVAHAVNAGGLPGGPYFILLALPGLLFVIAALADESRRHAVPKV